MEIPNITPLNQLDATKRDVTIKVSIIKLWKLLSFKVKNAIHVVELTLMDEEGSKFKQVWLVIISQSMENYLKKNVVSWLRGLKLVTTCLRTARLTIDINCFPITLPISKTVMILVDQFMDSLLLPLMCFAIVLFH
ncbi:hypothetical protein Hdeb2414_s0008g00295951 [Helianthus debilis subsp. tardiflorus]